MHISGHFMFDHMQPVGVFGAITCPHSHIDQLHTFHSVADENMAVLWARTVPAGGVRSTRLIDSASRGNPHVHLPYSRLMLDFIDLVLINDLD